MRNSISTKTIVALIAASVIAGISEAAAPQVTVTSFEQVGRRVEITYDLDADGIVTADVVTNGVSIGAQFLSSMYGDVNKAIAAGTGKKIYWSPEAAMNTTIHNAYAKLTAWALDAPPNYCVLDLAVKSNITYYASAEAVPFGVTNNIYKTERMVFRKIPAKGVQFRMGTPNDTSTEIPHRVTFTNDFYLGIYEITKRQANLVWSRTWNGSGYAGKDYTGADADFWMGPVTNVSTGVFRGMNNNSDPIQGGTTMPDGSVGLFRRMSNFTGVELDLPTEAQWEFACRAGSAEKYYWGSDSSDSLGDYAWYSGNSESRPHVVGLKKPNPWGLYDMYGNVRERCIDWYYTGNDYSDGSDVVEPNGVKGAEAATANRIHRGGAYTDAEADCRSAVRAYYYSHGPSAYLGGRLWMPPQAYMK